MAGKRDRSGSQKSDKRAAGHRALEIAGQIRECQDLLIKYRTAREIRDYLSDKYGMETRTADDRIKCARAAIKDDINGIERQELAAIMAEMALSVAKQAEERGQFNNVIGAMRLLGELGGLAGQNRV